MPRLNIEQFDDAPKVGDKVKVMGKVLSIDDSGEVEVSYDDVSIVRENKKRKNRDDNDEDSMDYTPDNGMQPEQLNPNTQTLDQALAQSFPNTQ